LLLCVECLPVTLPLSTASRATARPQLPRSAYAFALALAAAGVLLGAAHHRLAEAQSFEAASAEILVKPPATVPPQGQEAIDLALLFFGIRVPANAEHPVFDAELGDRGLTTRGAFFKKARVSIGPAAFANWALLGSTLAHELEVHCNQNLLAIYVMDAVGLDGTGEAERQAYAHELRHAKRFGLPISDSELIADTMEFYYPDDPLGKRTPGLRLWLARNFLRGQRS
jgi:hypothetical protein